MKSHLLLIALLTVSGAVCAAPVTYTADPDHTHPAFEVDHFGGLSVWRGIFKKTTGNAIVMDKAAYTGTVDIDVDLTSKDMAQDALSAELAGPKFFEANKYPTAHYHGTLGGFRTARPPRSRAS